VQHQAPRFNNMRVLRALGVLLALVALASCSSETVRVLDVGDLLSAEGLPVNGAIDDWADAERTWWTRYRMPLVVPFSTSSIRSLRVSVGTQGTWLISQETGADLGPPLELPEVLTIEHAIWRVRAYNSDGAVEFTKLVPVGRRLVRDACAEPWCAFTLENDTEASDLFSFSITAADLPAIPLRWPRPLTRFTVETTLTLRVRPQEVVFGHQPSPPLTLWVFLTAGNSVLYLAPK
jgi:hypothetical protein